MKRVPSYFYVGSQAIRKKVDPKYEGHKIKNAEAVKKWINETNQELIHESVIATFIINEQSDLVISDRHSEHVMCAGGRNVLSAGEITFSFENGKIFISEISNQSTGYCPRPASWEIVAIVLDQTDLEYPQSFTKAFEFRYCENCHATNLIKEEIYECVLCGTDLDAEWNFHKKKVVES